MKQYFLLGASSVYGVGGANGGWGELLKQYLHTKMYGQNGEGEKYEVFNFAKSGATSQFVIDTFPEQVKNYGRDGEIVAIVSVGGNDARATGTPENYVSTVEEYIEHMTALIKLLRAHTTKLLLANNGYIDESKTNPKISPFDGSKSYFTNARRIEFRDSLKKLCESVNVPVIDVGVTPEGWIEHYAYLDGLHPNNEGHQLIFETVKKALAL